MGIFRLLLALSVLVNHSDSLFGIPVMPGEMAVETFFVISGFYMAFIYKEKYSKHANAYRLFITNRFLRIFPVYWIILGFTLLVSLLLLVTGHDNAISSVASLFNGNKHVVSPQLFSVVFANLFIFGQGIGSFVRLDGTTGLMYFSNIPFQLHVGNPFYWFMVISPAWTLELELLFYLMSPLFLKIRLRFVILLILLSFLLRVVLYINGYAITPWVDRFFPTELAFFLFGTCTYYIYKKISRYKWKIKQLFIGAFIITFGIFLTYTYAKPLVIDNFNLYQWIYYLSLLLFVPLVFTLTKKITFDRVVGELSYPVYLIHMPVIDFLYDLHLHNQAMKPYFTPVAIILSVGLSYCLVKVFILKLDIFREKRVQESEKIIKRKLALAPAEVMSE